MAVKKPLRYRRTYLIWVLFLVFLLNMFIRTNLFKSINFIEKWWFSICENEANLFYIALLSEYKLVLLNIYSVIYSINNTHDKILYTFKKNRRWSNVEPFYLHIFSGEVENLPLFDTPTTSESLILLHNEDRKEEQEQEQ